RVDVSVGEVVDDAAGGAHDDHAQREDDQHLLLRLAFASDPEGPQRRPQQQPRADRTVEARKAPVFLNTTGETVVEGCLPGLASEHEVGCGCGAIHVSCTRYTKARTTGRPWRQGPRPTHPAWAHVR